MFLDGKDSNGINYVTETLEKGEKNLGLKVNYEKTRMHSSRMCTTCCRGHLSCHACPLLCMPPPHMPPAMHVPCHTAPCHAIPCHTCPLPCMPPPCHVCPLQCTSPAMHAPYHTCPPPLMSPTTQAPLPCNPPMDRQTPVKT